MVRLRATERDSRVGEQSYRSKISSIILSCPRKKWINFLRCSILKTTQIWRTVLTPCIAFIIGTNFCKNEQPHPVNKLTVDRKPKSWKFMSEPVSASVSHTTSLVFFDLFQKITRQPNSRLFQLYPKCLPAPKNIEYCQRSLSEEYFRNFPNNRQILAGRFKCFRFTNIRETSDSYLVSGELVHSVGYFWNLIPPHRRAKI